MKKNFRLSKRNLNLSAFFLIGISLSILSSVIVVSVGCGYFKFLECGYYAGFPVPYARLNEKRVVLKSNQFLVNPTYYYKHILLTDKESKLELQDLQKNGVIMPLFLIDNSLYNVDVLLFILNILIWLLPAGFIIGVFF